MKTQQRASCHFRSVFGFVSIANTDFGSLKPIKFNHRSHWAENV